LLAIIDYNMGNLSSVKNAFNKLGIKAEIIQDCEKLKNFDKIILPGVGAFADAMEHLKKYNLDEAIKEEVKKGKYLLGICLGMQLLLSESEEFGSTNGLNLIEGKVKYFQKDKIDKGLKIPQMGWNKVELVENNLFNGLNREIYLYFVHSLYCQVKNKDIIGKTYYGDKFASIINKDNIFGIQPHPEKSHDIGLKLLENFIKL